jgi:hypothetical protein
MGQFEWFVCDTLNKKGIEIDENWMSKLPTWSYDTVDVFVPTRNPSDFILTGYSPWKEDRVPRTQKGHYSYVMKFTYGFGMPIFDRLRNYAPTFFRYTIQLLMDAAPALFYFFEPTLIAQV